MLGRRTTRRRLDLLGAGFARACVVAVRRAQLTVLYGHALSKLMVEYVARYSLKHHLAKAQYQGKHVIVSKGSLDNHFPRRSRRSSLLLLLYLSHAHLSQTCLLVEARLRRTRNFEFRNEQPHLPDSSGGSLMGRSVSSVQADPDYATPPHTPGGLLGGLRIVAPIAFLGWS